MLKIRGKSFIAYSEEKSLLEGHPGGGEKNMGGKEEVRP